MSNSIESSQPGQTDFRGRTSSFYFETRPSRRSIDLDFDGASQYGYEYIDKIPAGSAVEEFYSRPLDIKNNRDKVEAENTTSTDEDMTKTAPTKNIGTLLLIRKVPVKVEPKVMFANERTFLFWMHSSLWLFGASLTVLRYSNGLIWKIYYGCFILCVGVIFVLYAIYQYRRRTIMLHNKDPGPYEDLIGPVILAVLLMITILIEFCFRLLKFAW